MVNPDIPNHKVQRKVDLEINRVIGSLLRESTDDCWVKYISIVQHSIKTSPHSTLQGNSPYHILFGREPVSGIQNFGIPEDRSRSYGGRNDKV